MRFTLAVFAAAVTVSPESIAWIAFSCVLVSDVAFCGVLSRFSVTVRRSVVRCRLQASGSRVLGRPEFSGDALAFPDLVGVSVLGVSSYLVSFRQLVDDRGPFLLESGSGSGGRGAPPCGGHLGHSRRSRGVRFAVRCRCLAAVSHLSGSELNGRMQQDQRWKMVAPASRYRPSCCSGDSGSRGVAALTGVIDRGQTGRSRKSSAICPGCALSRALLNRDYAVEVGGEREQHLGLVVDSGTANAISDIGLGGVMAASVRSARFVERTCSPSGLGTCSESAVRP